MQSAGRQQCTEVNKRRGTGGRCKEVVIVAASPTPQQTSEIPLKDPVSTIKATFLLAGEQGCTSAPQPGGSRRGEPTSGSPPSGGLSRLISNGGGGRVAEGGASPQHGSHHGRDGFPGVMELKLAPSTPPLPGYLFASSSSCSSGSVAAITTSHSAAAAILPPGPERRVGGRR